MPPWRIFLAFPGSEGLFDCCFLYIFAIVLINNITNNLQNTSLASMFAYLSSSHIRLSYFFISKELWIFFKSAGMLDCLLVSFFWSFSQLKTSRTHSKTHFLSSFFSMIIISIGRKHRQLIAALQILSKLKTVKFSAIFGVAFDCISFTFPF